jgi:uridine kinase
MPGPFSSAEMRPHNVEEDMSTDAVDFVELATRVKRVAIGHPRAFVGIDGPGASGKSTLAEQLGAAMGDAHLVHVDDFYLPSSRRHERLGEVGPLFDLPRLAEQVVVPGSAGEALRYQRYDWLQDGLAQWIDVPSGAPIVLEGVFCLAAEFRNAYTFKIWCRADPMLRLSRGLARDGEEARSLWIDVWMPAEDEYAASQHPERIVDLVVDSSPNGVGDQVFRIVAA